MEKLTKLQPAASAFGAPHCSALLIVFLRRDRLPTQELFDHSLDL